MNDSLRAMPAELVPEFQRRLVALEAACADHGVSLPAMDSALRVQFDKVLATSAFVARQFTQNPALLQELVASGDLQRTYAPQDLPARLAALVGGVDQETELVRRLRALRQREMCRLVWRDFNRLADTMGTTTELSWLAEACLDQSLDWLYRRMCADIGVPTGAESGAPQRLVVLGMGKLGGWELNLSSDIDLIFAFPESGETIGGRRTLSNQDFFTRLGQALIRVLDSQGHDGFVFRVDMRLRPYGNSGALACSFDAMESYYHDQGRYWERYAMVKARVVAGDRAAGERLMAILVPFVYRRYIDFSAFDALRDMKQMINREVKRRALADDVKLGPGGIREVEFIAQAFQLIRGGREPELRDRRLLPVLAQLGATGCLPPAVVSELDTAYRFLRDTEHGIQGYDDRQTQSLPTEVLPRAALAWVMGYPDWESFCAELERHRAHVKQHFADVITPVDETRKEAEVETQWEELWLSGVDEALARSQLQAAGFDTRSFDLLVGLRDGRRVDVMQAEGRQRLDRFMPLLLTELAAQAAPGLLLERVLPLVEAVLRRTAYLVLLLENREAREQLYLLCAASPWIAQQLARHPVLLDELVNVASLYTVPEKSDLRAELNQQLLRLEWNDLEGHMEALRYFRLAHVLHIVAAEVTGRLPLMKVSDYLTFLAEVILEHVLALAWHNMVARHGQPLHADGSPCQLDFVILGYGKLGGLELGPGSDLDLVFVHDADPVALTNGNKPVEGQVFFTRLGQRIIHVLSTVTTMGELYEVDMRLRPSGNSGLLVASLSAFERYQREDAWTWEHQALVRARPVAGDTALARKLEALRIDVLRRPRDVAQLRGDVIAMRERMRSHLLPADAEAGDAPYFHLKQGTGGIVDIEFMVQFAVLAYAREHPALATWTDNIRILEAMGAVGLLTPEQESALREAYKAFRACSHRLALQQQQGSVPVTEFSREREQVRAMWRAFEQGDW